MVIEAEKRVFDDLDKNDHFEQGYYRDHNAAEPVVSTRSGAETPKISIDLTISKPTITATS